MRIISFVVISLVARACSARQSVILQKVHTRAIKQAVFGPAADAVNGAALGAGDVVRGATGGNVSPGFYVNASDGTLTGNGNLDLNAPLSNTCCNISFSGSDGIVNETVYAYGESGQIFPVAWPGWTGDIARTGNISLGVASGKEVNGTQGTFFFGDHIDNETGLVQTDWYTISGQLKPNATLAGYQFANKYFGFDFNGGNRSELYLGTGTKAPNGVRRLLSFLGL